MRLRSVLFAPASDEAMVMKMPRSRPDCIVLDLEDAVPATGKANARAQATRLAPMLRAEHPGLAIFVRVNSPTTTWFADDLGALTHGLTGVVVPKLESSRQRDEVVAALRDVGMPLPIFAGIETVAGVHRCEEILDSPDVAAGYFGAEDFIADLGGVRTREGTEVLYARSRVAIAARLAAVGAVDQVVPTLRDDELFLADAALGRSLGFRGKLCIHPAQVTLANAAFTPSPEALDRARRMVAAYEAAAVEGRASIDFDGQMVDEPLVRQARALLADP